MGEVLELQRSIEKYDYRVFITDATEKSRKGSKKLERIIEALSSSSLVVVMGTKDYGEEIPDILSSRGALVYALQEKKRIFLFKMCDHFQHRATAAYLKDQLDSGDFEEWKVGEELSTTALGKVLKSLRKALSDSTGVPTPNLREEASGKELPKGNFGAFDFSNDVQYVGQWKDQKMHGFGKMTYSDGSVYEGGFDKGKKHGLGKYRFGELNESAGDIYEGNFKQGVMEGEGVLTYSPFGKWAGDRYVGQWKAGKREGYGTYYYKSGAQYTGHWVNGLKHGQGDFLFANKDRYSGEYVEGKKHGYGTYTFAGGDKYTGEWKNNKRHGQGEYFSADTGNLYKGTFAHGAEDGYGELYFGEHSNYHGDNFKGLWKKGKMHGEGVYTSKTGKRREGRWQNGEAVNE